MRKETRKVVLEGKLGELGRNEYVVCGDRDFVLANELWEFRGHYVRVTIEDVERKGSDGRASDEVD